MGSRQNSISIENLLQLTSIFDVSIDELIFGQEFQNKK